MRVLDLRDGGFADVAAMFAAFAMADTPRRVARPGCAGRWLTALAGATCAWALATVLTPLIAGAPMRPPAILVRNLEGVTVNLAIFRGKPLVINVWASWCPPVAGAKCRCWRMPNASIPTCNSFLSTRERTVPEIQRFLHAHRLGLRNVFADRLRQVGSATNSIGMPTTLFFNRQGDLLARHVGEIDARSLDVALAPLKRQAGRTD